MSEPLKYREPTPEEVALYRKGCNYDFIFVGEKEYVIPRGYKDDYQEIMNFPLGKDDIWLLGLSRTGSITTQEIIWLIRNNLDFKKANEQHIDLRVPSIEYFFLFRGKDAKPGGSKAVDSSYERWLNQENGKLIKTHLPISLLPKNLINSGAKIIYIIRDPREIIVSFFSFVREGTFADLWKAYKNNLGLWWPYFEHVKEAWAVKDKENVLLIYYNELATNKYKIVDTIGKFLGEDLSEIQVHAITDYCRNKFNKRLDNQKAKEKEKEVEKVPEKGKGKALEKKKKNSQEDWDKIEVVRDPEEVAEEERQKKRREREESIYEKEKWKKFFVGELEQEVEEWMRVNLEGCDIKFTSF